MFISFALGNLVAMYPDMNKAQVAAMWLYKVITAGYPKRNIGNRPDIAGNIEFVDVDFAYPTRPEAQVSIGSLWSFKCLI